MTSILVPSEAQPENGQIKVTWLGTTSLLLDDGDSQIMIDGFISRSCFSLGGYFN